MSKKRIRKPSGVASSGAGGAADNGVNGIRRYGRRWPGFTALDIELWCFREDLKPDDGGLGRAEHFWNVTRILWGPDSAKEFIRHPWAEIAAEEASANQFLSVSGCADSGKTDFFAVWGIVQWLCDPLNTKVIVTSTTLRESRKRIWGAIVDYWNALDERVSVLGKLVDSYGLIRLSERTGYKASERCGIELVPSEKSKEKEAIGKLIGIKQGRRILIADELPELSPAIMNAVVSNWRGNVQGIGIGNPASYFDAHGVFSMPEKGWRSIDATMTKWKTRYGVATRFDAEKSPNVLAGRKVYSFLPTAEQIEEARHRLGPDSVEFWRMWKGFWCPEGAADTVYSEGEISFYGADSSKVEWSEPPVALAALDAGYTNGGDRSIAYFALLGKEAKSGQVILCFTEFVLLSESVTDKTPRNFQIARAFRDECGKRGVAPERAAVDATGSPAFADIVASEWSPDVLRVFFGGKSSKRATASGLPADATYGNRVTEVWFGLREYLEAGQVRGIEPDFARELTARRYVRKKADGSTVVTVEQKRVMKGRAGQSPDIADAGLIVVELARTRMKFRPDAKYTARSRSRGSWRKFTDRVSGKKPKLRMAAMAREGNPVLRSRSGFGRGLKFIR